MRCRRRRSIRAATGMSCVVERRRKRAPTAACRSLSSAATALRPEPAALGPLDLAARLRVDHGAIAALLVPTPTRAIVDDLLSVLAPHNRREEEPGGAYDASDQALGPEEAARLAAELEAFPEPPLNPYNDGPAVAMHIAETLALSRRQWEEADGSAR